MCKQGTWILWHSSTRKRWRKKLQLPKLLKHLKVRHYRHPNSRVKVLWVNSTGGFSLSRAQSSRQSSYYISVFALNWADTSRYPLHGNSALVIRWKSFPGHSRRQSRKSLKGTSRGAEMSNQWHGRMLLGLTLTRPIRAREVVLLWEKHQFMFVLFYSMPYLTFLCIQIQINRILLLFC